MKKRVSKGLTVVVVQSCDQSFPIGVVLAGGVVVLPTALARRDIASPVSTGRECELRLGVVVDGEE